jgi:glycosyltransferase involved in cell wall biosynthesis
MKISVVIPAYNAEAYLAQAIESCLQQTRLPHEVIVADDGSTDRTAEIAEKFPPPVRLVRLPQNMGLSAARNRAVEASTGEWLAFLDADDWFLPNKLELQERCILENPNAVLVYSGCIVTNTDGSSQREGHFVRPNQLGWWLRYAAAFHVCSVLLRRDAFDEIGGFNSRYRAAEDWDMWLRIADRYSTAAFGAAPEPLVMYRQVAGSLSSNAMRMFNARYPIIESRCLYQTSGIGRQLLRRRVEAFVRFDTAIQLREEGSPGFLGFMLKSLALWPFPHKMLPLRRYKCAAAMMMQQLGLKPSPLRLSAASRTANGH